MTLLIDRREELRQENRERGTAHALIVGVSDYPHLPGDPHDLKPWHYGMLRLSSAALSAYRFYAWLTDPRTKLPVELATCRVLLSPSEAEIAADRGLAALHERTGDSGRATLEAFRKDALDWRKDAARGRQGVTYFFFAGHGIEHNERDVVLLLEGFGQADCTGARGDDCEVLSSGVRLQNIFNIGMAPPSSSAYIARTQFYFIDACRTSIGRLEHDGCHATPTAVFEPIDTLGARDDRRPAAIVYATVSGDTAVGIRNVGSVFSQALDECLRGDAGDVDKWGQWFVPMPRLGEVLTRKMKAIDHELLPEIFGIFGEGPVCRLTERPWVTLRFRVVPDDALPAARVLTWGSGRKETSLPVPLQPHPHELRLPAGHYGARAESVSGEWRVECVPTEVQKVLPPCDEWQITATRVPS